MEVQEDIQAAGDQEQEKKEQDETADEPPLFGEDGKDEVRVLFGEEVQLALGPLEKAFAEEGAGPDGDLRLVDMVSGFQWVEVGVQEGEEPAPLILFHEMPKDGDRDGHSRAHDQPGPSVDARKDKHRGEDDHQEGDGAQVGLFEDEERGEARGETEPRGPSGCNPGHFPFR